MPAKYREDSGRVSGRDDRGKQERLVKCPVKQAIKNPKGRHSRQNYTPGGKTARRKGNCFEVRTFCGKTTIKKYKYQCKVCYLVGQSNIIKVPEPQDITSKENSSTKGNQYDRDTPAVKPDRSQGNSNQQYRPNNINNVHNPPLFLFKASFTYRHHFTPGR